MITSVRADMVLFSNFSSPEYIIDLGQRHTDHTSQNRVGYRVSDCYFSPWHPGSPSLCTSSGAHRLKRNILPELQWLPQATTPSSL
uniref:Uncharacterized protein n=1 Tax=Lates calcarifer TaxID=8187 RepID=A0A4W6DL29_LATCA